MSIWNRLPFFRRRRDEELRPQRLDYLNEALALERQGDYEAALTSYRLALRDHPNDLRVLQNWRLRTPRPIAMTRRSASTAARSRWTARSPARTTGSRSC